MLEDYFEQDDGNLDMWLGCLSKKRVHFFFKWVVYYIKYTIYVHNSQIIHLMNWPH